MTPEYFSGVVVHPGLDALNLVAGDGSEIGAFGEKTASVPVGNC